MINGIKCTPRFFNDIREGRKRFEVRKNDRDYRAGERVLIEEWVEPGEYSGRKYLAHISYVLKHEDFPDGISPGYCVFGLLGIHSHKEERFSVDELSGLCLPIYRMDLDKVFGEASAALTSCKKEDGENKFPLLVNRLISRLRLVDHRYQVLVGSAVLTAEALELAEKVFENMRDLLRSPAVTAYQLKEALMEYRREQG